MEIDKGTYIAYHTGCGIWDLELFDRNIDWHLNEYRGSLQECEKKVQSEMQPKVPHYPGAAYGSIYDY